MDNAQIMEAYKKIFGRFHYNSHLQKSTKGKVLKRFIFSSFIKKMAFSREP